MNSVIVYGHDMTYACIQHKLPFKNDKLRLYDDGIRTQFNTYKKSQISKISKATRLIGVNEKFSKFLWGQT